MHQVVQITSKTQGRVCDVRLSKRGLPSSRTQRQNNMPRIDLFTTSPVESLPRVDFKALRLIPYGWGEGWQLRPSPLRRHWMDELPHAYKCLPLVVANQWGWQILCPTDVVVHLGRNSGPNRSSSGGFSTV